MYLLYICISWLAGLCLGSVLDIRVLPFLLLPAILAGFSLKKRFFLVPSICAFFLLMAIWRWQFSIPEASQVEPYIGRPVEITGVITGEPQIKAVSTSFHLTTECLAVSGQSINIKETILVQAPGSPGYQYGDRLWLSCTLEKPENLGEFDYRGYLAGQGINSTLYYPRIRILERGQGIAFYYWLYSLREAIAGSLSSVLPEPEASLAQALLLGIRDNLPPTLVQSFNETGTTHIIAISGLNISIITGIILSISVWLFGRRRPTYIIVTIAFIWFYAFLSGMQPPVIRATIMGTLFLLAQAAGRPNVSIVALVFAAAVMAGLTPRVLYDISFQFSFFSMSGLVLIAPLFLAIAEKYTVSGNRVTVRSTLIYKIMESLIITLSALIATAPLTIYYFGYFSAASLPATLLMLPALPGTIITGFLTAITGFLIPHSFWLTGWLSWLFLHYMVVIVRWFGSLPVTGFNILVSGSAGVWTYYTLLALAVYAAGSRTFRKYIQMKFSTLVKYLRPAAVWQYADKLTGKWIILGLITLNALVWLSIAAFPEKKFEVSFLDVGSGDAIYIQTENGHKVLIDGGPGSHALTRQLSKKLPFWDRNIDLVILTHPHEDHVGGLNEVLKRYKVGQVLGPFAGSGSDTYKLWLKTIEKKQIKYTVATGKESIKLGESAMIQVLWPESDIFGDDADNNGLVLRLVKGNISFLLTADIKSDAEKMLLIKNTGIQSTVLKVSHHGGRDSTSSGFLNEVEPQAAVISVGLANPFGHPHRETITRLKEILPAGGIYLTSEEGSITFTTDGKKLLVRTER